MHPKQSLFYILHTGGKFYACVEAFLQMSFYVGCRKLGYLEQAASSADLILTCWNCIEIFKRRTWKNEPDTTNFRLIVPNAML
jgi:hypothetical protein